MPARPGLADIEYRPPTDGFADEDLAELLRAFARVDPFAERLRSGEVLDAIPHMTRGIPTLIIAHMLGIEPDMFEQFSDWSDAIGASA